jgi:hypothetical protein
VRVRVGALLVCFKATYVSKKKQADFQEKQLQKLQSKNFAGRRQA